MASFIGKSIDQLPTPFFLINKEKVENNCQKMIKKAKQWDAKLRCQTKTHKTIELAVLQTGGSKRSLVVSTLKEAEFYADEGFDDILYGYPLISSHFARCQKLMTRLEQFHVMVDNVEIVEKLLETAPAPGKKWSAFMSIDCGNGREGVVWSDSKAVDVAEKMHNGPHTIFQGIYCHCGNSYADDVSKVQEDTVSRLRKVQEKLLKNGIPCQFVGTGSTPSCSIDNENLKFLNEIHPGCYSLYDIQQMQIGSCTEADIAGRVATRVIGHYPHRNQMLIDCGFTALTKQGYGAMKTGYAVFQGHPELKLMDMTQEIGKVGPIKGKLDFSKYPVGTMLFLYPYHACATAGMHPVYYIHEGKSDKITEVWQPTRGW